MPIDHLYKPMSLSNLHDRLSAIIVLILIIIAVWGLWRAYHKQGLDGAYWGALAILEVLILFQAGLGIYLWISTQRPEGGFLHILYACFSSLTLPAAYAFTHGRDTRQEALTYGLVLLVLVILAGRTIATGGG